jgi:hypothetical protein
MLTLFIFSHVPHSSPSERDVQEEHDRFAIGPRETYVTVLEAAGRERGPIICISND